MKRSLDAETYHTKKQKVDHHHDIENNARKLSSDAKTSCSNTKKQKLGDRKESDALWDETLEKRGEQKERAEGFDNGDEDDEMEDSEPDTPTSAAALYPDGAKSCGSVSGTSKTPRMWAAARLPLLFGEEESVWIGDEGLEEVGDSMESCLVSVASCTPEQMERTTITTLPDDDAMDVESTSENDLEASITIASCYPGDAYAHIFTAEAKAELERAALMSIPDDEDEMMMD